MRPRSAPPDGGGQALLVLLLAAQFMVVADSSIMNVALPSIQTALGFSPSGLQWVLTAYALTYGGFLLLGGRLGDLVGSRRVLLAGLVVFALASLGGGLAVSPAMLVLARAVQGFGAALIAPATLALINMTVVGDARRRRALSWWGAVNAAGFAAGVLLGGVLVEFLSWRAALLVNVPATVLAGLGAVRLLPAEATSTARGHYDLPGAVTVTAPMALLVYLFSRAPEVGWTSVATLMPLVCALALMGGFVVIEARAAAPLVPLGMFRHRLVSAANGVIAMFGLCAGVGLFFLLSLYMQQVWGYSPLLTGLAFLPLGLLIFASAPLVGRLLTLLSAAWVLLPGLGLTAAGLGWLSLLSPHGGYLTGLLPGLVLIGLGYGPVQVTTVTAATTSRPASEQGLASGVFNTTANVAGALGAAIYTQIVASAGQTSDPTALASGYTTAFTVGAALAALALALAVIAFPRTSPPHRHGLLEQNQKT